MSGPLVKVWCIKYWATAGVSIHMMERVESHGGVFYSAPRNALFLHKEGVDYALSEAAAAVAVTKLAAKKKASLEKQLAAVDKRLARALKSCALEPSS